MTTAFAADRRIARRDGLAPGERALRPTGPNLGIAAAYRKRLDALIADMTKDTADAVLAAYKATPPLSVALGQDAALPADKLRRAVKRMADKWLSRFDRGAPQLAAWFAQSTQTRTEAQLRKVLRDAGFTVRFKPSRILQDAMAGATAESVGLIKTIPQQYFQKIEGAVMRGSMAGMDLHEIKKAIDQTKTVTQRRAKLIAVDQGKKVHSVVTQHRYLDAGITEAIWMHSHGSQEPRPSHVAANGKRYQVSQGMYLEDIGGRWAWLQPGWAIGCKCRPRPVLSAEAASEARR